MSKSPTSSKKPHYILKGLNKTTEERTEKLGVAWNNPDGSIRLVLNRFVDLPTEPEWVYTLFPNKGE